MVWFNYIINQNQFKWYKRAGRKVRTQSRCVASEIPNHKNNFQKIPKRGNFKRIHFYFSSFWDLALSGNWSLDFGASAAAQRQR